MATRLAVLVVLVCALGVAEAQGQGKAPVRKTPEDAFAEAKAAAAKGDLRGFFGVVAPDALEEMALGLALTGLTFRARAVDDPTGALKVSLKPMFDALDKHGLSAEAVSQIKLGKPDKEDKTGMKLYRPIIERITDKPGFVAEIVGVVLKFRKADGDEWRRIGQGELKDLKVTGDKAEAVVIVKKGDKESRSPLRFVKVGESWHILMETKYTPPGK